MHAHDLALRLITNFGKLLDLEGLTLQGGTHNCALEFDGNITVTFEYHEPTSQMLLTAVLGTPPAEGAEPLLRELMAGNLSEFLQLGVALGLDEASQCIVLMQGRPVQELDDPTFEKMVERFIDRAEFWQQRIESLGTSASPQPQAQVNKLVPDGAHIFG